MCNNAAMPLRELTPPETGQAFTAMRELRPHLTSEDAFVQQVNAVQRPQGYRLVASFDDGEAEASAVAGFRLGSSLAWGRYLYVDDLSTVPAARSKGHATALLQWTLEEARRHGCDQVALDSGVGRHDAHRLYMSSGYVISSFHFTRRDLS